MLDKGNTRIPLLNYLNLGTLAVTHIDHLEFNSIRFENCLSIIFNMLSILPTK